MPHTLTAISKEEKVGLQKAYRRLMRSIKAPLDEVDRKNIRKAYELGLEAHQWQRRKSGEPYFYHPIEVARICVNEIGLGPTAIICALLHDVVEDTDVTIEEIHEQFGKKIGKIVDGLTKLDGLYNVESPQAENFKKVISTLVDDVRVVLIKMADRIHNLRTIGVMPRHKQLKIAGETDYIYAPLAHRLGLYNIKTEFQDIILQIQEPENYAELSQNLRDTKGERDRYIYEFIKPIKQRMNELGIKYKISGRPKSLSSIQNKIAKKQVSFEEIYDLFAIRIVLDVPLEEEKQVCWQVYSIITEIHKPIPERLKDWVTTPKSNGYESLHTTVIGPKGRFVEIQIRTERMDEIAERGFAAHWKYKEVKSQQHVYENWLDSIRDMLEDNHNDALEFISDFKTNLFNKEVYVYTPNGDLKILPKGATALDFAFSIHSDIGYHATAIKVNNKLVPMGHELQNGDQVSVSTNKNQKPNESWLKMVVTGKARSKIRSSMKEEKRKKGAFGKESLKRKLKNLKIDFEENVDGLAKYLGFNSRIDLYFAIANENVDLKTLKTIETEGHQFIFKKKHFLASDLVVEPEEGKKKKEKKRKKKTKTDEAEILINGEPGSSYNFQLATCCNPVFGDDIFGYVSANTGFKVHRTTCPNAIHMMANYGYRMMKAEWNKRSGSNFVVELQISGIDDGPGVIERVTHKISSDLGINIRSFSIAGNEGYFEGKVSLMVLNKDQLNQTIRTLKKLKGISNVVRIN